jgi:hypothetical protein
MTGDLENETALDHPGNAVVIPLTVGFDPWETHELGGDDNTTNRNNVILNCYRAPNYLTCPSSFSVPLPSRAWLTSARMGAWALTSGISGKEPCHAPAEPKEPNAVAGARIAPASHAKTAHVPNRLNTLLVLPPKKRTRNSRFLCFVIEGIG